MSTHRIGIRSKWLLVFTSLASLSITATVPTSGSELPFLDAQTQRVMEEWQAPGAVVVVLADGDVVHARAYGVADLRTRVPVDLERTTFRLASLSKPVTATALVRLRQLGKIDLDGDVNDYLDPFRVESRGTLTASHLLTHTGGFEERFLRRFTRQVGALPDLAEYLRVEMPPQIYAPGQISTYSNHGMALAGLLVAELLDRPFEEAMRELLFEPLGMASTTFDPRRAGSSLAQGHRRGELVPVLGIKTIPSSMLVSSAGDMTRLMLALLEPQEDGLLSQESIDLLLRRHFEHHSSFTGRALGWSEDSSVSPRRLFHSGGTDGFSSAIVLVPERRGGIFVAFNANAYVWELVRAVLDAVFAATPRDPGAEPTEGARRPIASQPSSGGAPSALRDRAARIAGRYAPAELPRSSFDKVRLLFEQSRLRVEAGGVLDYRGARFEPATDGSYLAENGQRLVLREGQNGERFLLEEGGAWVRLPWHAATPLHLGLLTVLVLSASAVATGPPAMLGLRRGRQRVLASPVELRAAAGLLLVFLLGTGGVVGISMARDGGDLRFEIPWYLIVLLALPLVSLALAAMGAVRIVRTLLLQDGGGSPAREERARWPAAIGWVTVVAFTGFLAYWRMLGFWF